MINLKKSYRSIFLETRHQAERNGFQKLAVTGQKWQVLKSNFGTKTNGLFPLY